MYIYYLAFHKHRAWRSPKAASVLTPSRSWEFPGLREDSGTLSLSPCLVGGVCPGVLAGGKIADAVIAGVSRSPGEAVTIFRLSQQSLKCLQTRGILIYLN